MDCKSKQEPKTHLQLCSLYSQRSGNNHQDPTCSRAAARAARLSGQGQTPGEGQRHQGLPWERGTVSTVIALQKFSTRHQVLDQCPQAGRLAWYYPGQHYPAKHGEESAKYKIIFQIMFWLALFSNVSLKTVTTARWMARASSLSNHSVLCSWALFKKRGEAVINHKKALSTETLASDVTQALPYQKGKYNGILAQPLSIMAVCTSLRTW